MNIEEFANSENTVDLHVKYDDALKNYVKDKDYIAIGKVASGNNAVLYINKENYSQLAREMNIREIDYVALTMGLLGTSSMEKSGILEVQKNPLNLKGKGVLVGFVDTGIDYKNEIFLNSDGNTRIKYIWDQTIKENSPEGYYYGAEYTEGQINQALKAGNSYSVVPHYDIVGHGTFLASVACGNGTDEYIGAAPEAGIISVKLRKAKQYYIDRFLVPKEQENVYESTDVMLGIQYIIEKAASLNMPVAICIGVGTNMGGHDGFSELEKYIGVVSNFNGVCISQAARE